MKYAWRINRQKSTLLILLILILSVSRLAGAFQIFGTLCAQMSGNVNLYCSISGADSQYISQIRGLSGVSYVTGYNESSHTLSYKAYSIQIRLVGCERSYLQERYSESIVTAMEGSMPYIIFDESVLSAMTNEKGEKIEIDAPDAFLLENFEVDDIKTRLCGLTRETLDDSDEQQRDVFYVYTTLDGYEALTADQSADSAGNGLSRNGFSGDGLSGNGLPRNDSDRNAAAENKTMPALSGSTGVKAANSTSDYLVVLKNGFYLNQILDVFSKNGITYAFDGDNDLQIIWDNKATQGWQLLELSGVMILSALLVTYYQGQLWRIKHRPFLCYLSQFKHYKRTLRRMMAGRILWLVFISIPCGVVLFLLGI